LSHGCRRQTVRVKTFDDVEVKVVIFNPLRFDDVKKRRKLARRRMLDISQPSSFQLFVR